MKKAVSILLSVILLLSLTACGESLEAAEVIEVNTAQDCETYVEGEDYQQRWNFWGSVDARLFTLSDSGYYYYSNYGDLLLHFYDFATETDVIVCGQPNCDHTSTECNARLSNLGINLESIQYYDGNLYVIGVKSGITQDVCVYRISTDGGTRGMVGTLLTMSQGQSVSCIVHRGYAYCVLEKDGLNKQKINVYRLPLCGGEDTEIIYSFDAAYGAGASLKAYGNYLYISYKFYTDKDGSDYGGDIYRYNIHTGEVEWVLENLQKPFAIDDSYIYYSTLSQVRAYNMESGETTVLIEQGPMYFAIDGDYLYCDNRFHILLLPSEDGINSFDNRIITVIDRNTFETVATIPLTVSNSYLVGARGTQMLAYYDYGFYAYDLNALLDGEESAWVEMN